MVIIVLMKYRMVSRTSWLVGAQIMIINVHTSDQTVMMASESTGLFLWNVLAGRGGLGKKDLALTYHPPAVRKLAKILGLSRLILKLNHLVIA